MKHGKANPTVYLGMGLVWIALAIFGLVFDPDKNLITISQVVAGVICLGIYLYARRRA